MTDRAGCAWQAAFPVVPVYDLKIKDADLVAGTHGRSFWILDDISPLRTLADGKYRNAHCRAACDDPYQAAFRLAGRRAGPFSFAITFGIGGGIATT